MVAKKLIMVVVIDLEMPLLDYSDNCNDAKWILIVNDIISIFTGGD